VCNLKSLLLSSKSKVILEPIDGPENRFNWFPATLDYISAVMSTRDISTHEFVKEYTSSEIRAKDQINED